MCMVFMYLSIQYYLEDPRYCVEAAICQVLSIFLNQNEQKIFKCFASSLSVNTLCDECLA